MKKLLILYFLFALFSLRLIAQESQVPTPQWRPLYHFTPETNWTNDPNGLIYLSGEYHLYNQQNPFENKWGHMSWGHATSNDLVHWKHLSIAMPETIDKDTIWRFSGCAVLDKNNTSGFCINSECIVAVYTADQPNLKKESQFIAYSNDGGMSLTNYANNPVIDLQKKDFRDPNVSWNEQLKKWLMVVSLPTEHKLRFYISPDLKNWDQLSEFGPQGYTGASWECPFFIQLAVDGEPSIKKWVLVNSAAGGKRGVFMQYFVGDFDGKVFKNDNSSETVLAVDYGDCFYAAIPWNNLPDDKKTYIGWMIPQPQETYPWRGQMSIPRDLRLKRTAKGFRLMQPPSALIKNELAKLSAGHVSETKNLKLDDQEISIGKELSMQKNSYWLDAEIEVGRAATAGFKIAQKKDKDNKILAETVIGYDPGKHELYVDRSKVGNGKLNKDRLRQTMSLENETGKINLEILVDQSSLEVFVNKGERVLTTNIFPDDGANGVSAFATGGKAVVKSLKIWDLSKIKKG